MTTTQQQFKYRGAAGRRVVMTGSGMITSLGLSVAENWDAIIAGRCGISKLENIDLTGQEVHVGAQVGNFQPTNYMDRKEARRMDRYCQFAVAAAAEAMSQSKLNMDNYGAERVGTIIGSGVGGLETLAVEFAKLHERGPARISPLFIPMMISNMAAGKISMIYGTKGNNFCVTTACASGTHAIGEAYRAIKYGHIDACIAGGAEAPITPIALAGFNNMTALTREEDPTQASIPFDIRRSGFVIAEGAGVVVLEELEGALARGADIICEIGGYGATADAYHITSPDPEGHGAAQAMLLAIAEAGLEPENIDYINAHGTSTPLNDKFETLAIKTAFGSYADKIPVSSTKSMTGHLLGAAGAVEAIYTALMLKNGMVAPTIALREADPECDLDYVPDVARKANIRAALSNSLGFGGHNGTLCFKKWEDA
jgi:3-oxoacyl-[acyl-carrier-protein] synthase II